MVVGGQWPLRWRPEMVLVCVSVLQNVMCVIVDQINLAYFYSVLPNQQPNTTIMTGIFTSYVMIMKQYNNKKTQSWIQPNFILFFLWHVVVK